MFWYIIYGMTFDEHKVIVRFKNGYTKEKLILMLFLHCLSLIVYSTPGELPADQR